MKKFKIKAEEKDPDKIIYGPSTSEKILNYYKLYEELIEKSNELFNIINSEHDIYLKKYFLIKINIEKKKKRMKKEKLKKKKESILLNYYLEEKKKKELNQKRNCIVKIFIRKAQKEEEERLHQLELEKQKQELYFI